MKEHERREKAALQFAESAKQELANMKAQTQQIDTNYVKELEAYVMEDKPRKVKDRLEKYCL